MLSHYLAEMFGRFYRTSSITKPSGIWVALFQTLPEADGTGGVEVNGGGYARVRHGPGNAQWAESGPGVLHNASPVAFGTPTADWGDIVGIGLYTALTGGSLLNAAALNTPITIKAFDTPLQFAVGELTIEIGARTTPVE